MRKWRLNEMGKLDIFLFAVVWKSAHVYCSVVEGLADAHQLTLDALEFCLSELLAFRFIII